MNLNRLVGFVRTSAAHGISPADLLKRAEWGSLGQAPRPMQDATRSMTGANSTGVAAPAPAAMPRAAVAPSPAPKPIAGAGAPVAKTAFEAGFVDRCRTLGLDPIAMAKVAADDDRHLFDGAGGHQGNRDARAQGAALSGQTNAPPPTAKPAPGWWKTWSNAVAPPPTLGAVRREPTKPSTPYGPKGNSASFNLYDQHDDPNLDAYDKGAITREYLAAHPMPGATNATSRVAMPTATTNMAPRTAMTGMATNRPPVVAAR